MPIDISASGGTYLISGSGTLRWKNIWQHWATISLAFRDASARLWSYDGINFQKKNTISFFSLKEFAVRSEQVPSSHHVCFLYRHRTNGTTIEEIDLCWLLYAFKGSSAVGTWFKKKTWAYQWCYNTRVKYQRRHFPYYGQSPHPWGWFWMGYGNCCLYDPSITFNYNLMVKSHLPPTAQASISIWDFVSAFSEKHFALTALADFLFIFGLFIPINYIIIEAINAGMSPRLANYLAPILNAARSVVYPWVQFCRSGGLTKTEWLLIHAFSNSLFGQIIPGMLSDKLGRYNIFIIVSYFTSIIVFTLWILASSNSTIIILLPSLV